MKASETQPTGLLNEYELAKHLHVSVATIRRMRYQGDGPQFLKLGASVRYSPIDIDTWLETKKSNQVEAA